MSAARPANLRRSENDFRIERVFQVITNIFYHIRRFADELLELDEQTWNISAPDPSRQLRGHAPMRDHVINRESFCPSRFLQRDLRRKNRARIAKSDQ